MNTQMGWLSLSSRPRLWFMVFAAICFACFETVSQAQPRVSAVLPGKAKVGEAVGIQGVNFSSVPNDNAVFFGRVRAQVTSASSTSLAVVVPAGAEYSPVSVTVGGLTGWSKQPFNVLFSGFGPLNSGSFEPHVDLLAGGSQENTAAGDLDGDGRLDLVVPNSESLTISIYRNTGTAGVIDGNSLQSSAELETAGTPMAVAIGDVDGDGKLDIVVANREGTISVFRNISAIGNLGVSSFAPRVDFAVPSEDLRGLAVGDVDGDGKLDVALCSGEGFILVLRNTGTLGSVNYAGAVSFPGEAGELVSLVLGDIDCDGKLDLLVANNATADIFLLRNISVAGSASFESPVIFAVGTNPYGVGLADLDGDGRPELLAINSGSGTLSVFRNSSSPGSLVRANFPQRSFNFMAAPGAMTIAVGDVNGDGKPDVAFANGGVGAASVLLNTSTSLVVNATTLAPKVNFATDGPSRSVLLADMDGDGKVDLVVSQSGTSLFSLLHNNFPTIAPPAITTQPVPQNATSGDTVTLSVQVTGGQPLSFQWRWNGVDLPGANSSTLTLQNAQATQSGLYSVVVSNPAGTVMSVDAQVSINTPPSAQSQSVAVNEDETVSITLAATDADNDPLTFSVTAPAHGQLSGTPPSVVYQPAPNYNGPDAFTFQVSDGKVSSAVATVAISVLAVNDAPVVSGQSVTTDEDTPVAIFLTGSDVDGDALSFAASTPLHGTLSGTAPNLVYTPAANYNGPDSFSFVANDGKINSAAATVSITVRSVNDAPVAAAQTVTTDEDTAVAVTLTASDVDGDALTFVATAPLHGTLSGTAPNLVYTPAANYNGPDCFTFVANDGKVNSPAAKVSITVRPVNDAPVAVAQSVSTDEDTAVSITLTASDVDGDALTFVATAPQHGTLSGSAPNLVYMPAANYNGPDCFTFVANDGKVSSATAKVTITVRPVNDAPVASSQSVSTDQNASLAIALAASDVDGDALTFSVTAPHHGSLSGTPPNLLYKPAANYSGPDSFSFTASDGKVSSAVGNVSITVRPVNHPPVARVSIAPLYALPSGSNCLAVLAVNNSSAMIGLDASLSSDPDKDPLQYCWMEGSTTPFATGVKVCRPFSVGFHTISLVVSDGKAQNMFTFRVHVVTPSDVLEDMIPLIDAANGNVSHSIYSSLDAAQSAFDQGDIATALNRLDTLQHKIKIQMTQQDPQTAALLCQLIQTLENAVSGH
jgi:hypothetical protein